MTLAAAEFLRRFFLHVLPKGFACRRHFGFLANRRRATLLPLCFQLLGTVAQSHIEQGSSVAKNSSPLWRCPKCGGKVVVIERLTPAQIQLRSPPWARRSRCMKLPITISLSRDSRSRPAACGMCTIICGAKFSVGAVLLIAPVLLLYAPLSSSNLARQRALNCVSQASLRSRWSIRRRD